MIINKAHFDVSGDNVRLTMPIAKIDEERRIVSGFATLDNIDRQGDVLLSDASRKAFENFRGNVRLMHQPIPAGKVVSFRENSFYDNNSGKTYSGIFVDAYISKGAENIWQMVLDGTLTGFSIGGRIVDYENQDSEDGNPVRVVKNYELMELSLVDSPANQFANIFSIQKLGDEIVTSGMATEISTENVFWCNSDNIAVSEKSDSIKCPICSSDMNEIGWIESNDINKNEEIGKLVDQFLCKDDSVKVGNFVSWSSSGGTARGKVERIVRSGSINVPGSDFNISADNEDPAVLIRVYREGTNGWEPTDTRVGHKMSTLNIIAPLTQKQDNNNDEESSLDKEVVTSDVTPNKNPQQGVPGRVPTQRKKKKIIFKSIPGTAEINDFIILNNNGSLTKGRIKSIYTSGNIKIKNMDKTLHATEENPLAVVEVYKENSFGGYSKTNKIIASPLSNLKKLQIKAIMKKEVIDTLNNITFQHNEKYDNVINKKVTFDMLQKVFNRGINAYQDNPGVNKSDAEAEIKWALGRVNGFLNAIRSNKFKNKPYDIDLLPMGHPLSMKKQEGGVEMAENETSHEELDTAQAVEETPEETVEFEVEETVEDVVTEALALAKSDTIEAEEESTSSEVFDMEKALGEVKSFVEDALSKSVESSTESLDKVTNAVLELAKAVDEKVGQLQAKYEEVTKSLADLNNATTEIASRVESVEEETAMKKSGELENSTPEQPVMRKSLWGGRFLSSADLFN